MKLLFYPFFSQQDKIDGKFLLDSDSGVRLYSYMASRAHKDGHTACIVLPGEFQCSCDAPYASPSIRVPYGVSLDNYRRRMQWDPEWLYALANGGYDLILTQHETLAIPLTCLNPQQKVLTECGMLNPPWNATEPLHRMARKVSTAVHCNSKRILVEMALERCKTFLWSFGYDGAMARPRAVVRDVDVLFNARCSVTGYTNHSVFVDAMAARTDWRVAITDPTRYLGSRFLVPTRMLYPCTNREQYTDLLHRSKVVVCMNTSGYGGYALYEAVACGAVPVVPRLPEYVELLGADWPYYLNNIAARDVLDVTHAALMFGWQISRERVLSRVAESSYESAWAQALRDMESVL